MNVFFNKKIVSYCPNCYTEIEAGLSYCIVCGQPLGAGVPAEEEYSDDPYDGITCSCGTVNDPDAKFCVGCGHALDNFEPPADEEYSDDLYDGITCSCGTVNDPDAKFCVGCGQILDNYVSDESEEEFCPVCGAPVESDAFFCSECSARLDRRNIDTMRCTECGGIINPESRICGVCGKMMGVVPHTSEYRDKKDISGGVVSTVKVSPKSENERQAEIERAKNNFKVVKDFDV